MHSQEFLFDFLRRFQLFSHNYGSRTADVPAESQSVSDWNDIIGTTRSSFHFCFIIIIILFAFDSSTFSRMSVGVPVSASVDEAVSVCVCGLLALHSVWQKEILITLLLVLLF